MKYLNNRITAILVGVGLLMLFAIGAKSENFEPKIKIGEESFGRILFCDTAKQAMSIVEEHEKNGLASAVELVGKLLNEPSPSGTPVCGIAALPFVVKNVVYKTKLDFNGQMSSVTVVEVDIMGLKYFAPFSGIEVTDGTSGT